jgi:hypothetical protein
MTFCTTIHYTTKASVTVLANLPKHFVTLKPT